MKSRIEYIIKHNRFIQKFYIICMSIILRFFGLFIRVDEKQILFNSLSGLNYNDSPRRIYEYMVSNEEFYNYKFIWAFEDVDKFDIPRGIKVKLDSFKYFKAALQSKFWITNMNIERGLKFKKKNQQYLNTWHGIGTKTMGLSEPGRNDYDFSNIDCITVQSEFEAKLFKRDFKAKNTSLVRAGLPRNDILFKKNKTDMEALKKYLDIPNEKKVILYAPTWRESSDKGKTYAIAPPMNLKKWKGALSTEYVLLFRTHHRTNKVMNVEFDEFLRDVSNYPEMNELLLITDVLITDYSTSIYDFSILRRPFFIFAYDFKHYKKTRGLVIDYEREMPYGIQNDEDEIINAIQNKDYYSLDKVDEFREKYVQYGGRAIKQSINCLFNLTE